MVTTITGTSISTANLNLGGTFVSDKFVSNNFLQDNSGGLAAVGANTFTSGSGNYTVPSGVNFLSGFVVGGGGGGGGHKQGVTNGGGGGSAPVAHFMTSVTPGSTIAYSVGSAGTGGNNATINGNVGLANAGGATNFGSYATSNGGDRGGWFNSASPGAAGNATGNALTFVSAGEQPEENTTTSPGGRAAQQAVGLSSTFTSTGTAISFGSVSGAAGAGGEGARAHNTSLNAQDGVAGAIVIVEFA